MSVRGFNTGTGVERYDYNALDNVPLTTNTRVKGDAEVEYRDGNVNITRANIGLGNVDNTSDANKPISTAQQRALDNLTSKLSDKDLFDDIPGTTQTVTFNANDQPASVVHTSGTDTVRSDVFTWADGTVTEARTLANGRHVTYVTNLTTLVTTISAVEEAT